MRTLLFALLVFGAGRAYAQMPTELYDCVDDADGPNFCAYDSTAVLVDAGCGATFNRYRAKIAWPVLWNVGPITIAVKTRSILFKGPPQVPLYIEVASRNAQQDPRDCRTGFNGFLILAAQGGPHCVGTWESVGPIDLAWFGIPLGTPYNVQAVFLESLPGTVDFHSIGFACIRITSHPVAVQPGTWTNIKVLYR
jgi:hypothetical protein